jgi:hypothetical protein
MRSIKDWLQGKKGLEPQNLDFMELCVARYPDKTWHELEPTQQVELIRFGLQAKHWLMDPRTTYMKTWDFVVLIALVFTAVVVPFEVTFKTDTLGTAFWISRVLDAIFLKDMFLQFFLKVEVKRPGGHGTILLKDPRLIRQHYLRSWFCIDILSVMPVDFVLLAVQDAGASSQLRGVKVVRVVRVLRLIKMARMLRSSRLVQKWQNYFAVPFTTQKIIKFACLLAVASH